MSNKTTAALKTSLEAQMLTIRITEVARL